MAIRPHLILLSLAVAAGMARAATPAEISSALARSAEPAGRDDCPARWRCSIRWCRRSRAGSRCSAGRSAALPASGRAGGRRRRRPSRAFGERAAQPAGAQLRAAAGRWRRATSPKARTSSPSSPPTIPRCLAASTASSGPICRARSPRTGIMRGATAPASALRAPTGSPPTAATCARICRRMRCARSSPRASRARRSPSSPISTSPARSTTWRCSAATSPLARHRGAAGAIMGRGRSIAMPARSGTCRPIGPGDPRVRRDAVQAYMALNRFTDAAVLGRQVSIEPGLGEDDFIAASCGIEAQIMSGDREGGIARARRWPRWRRKDADRLLMRAYDRAGRWASSAITPRRWSGACRRGTRTTAAFGVAWLRRRRPAPCAALAGWTRRRPPPPA